MLIRCSNNQKQYASLTNAQNEQAQNTQAQNTLHKNNHLQTNFCQHEEVIVAFGIKIKTGERLKDIVEVMVNRV